MKLSMLKTHLLSLILFSAFGSGANAVCRYQLQDHLGKGIIERGVVLNYKQRTICQDEQIFRSVTSGNPHKCKRICADNNTAIGRCLTTNSRFVCSKRNPKESVLSGDTDWLFHCGRHKIQRKCATFCTGGGGAICAPESWL